MTMTTTNRSTLLYNFNAYGEQYQFFYWWYLRIVSCGIKGK